MMPCANLYRVYKLSWGIYTSEGVLYTGLTFSRQASSFIWSQLRKRNVMYDQFQRAIGCVPGSLANLQNDVWVLHIDGLIQKRRNSIANALEIRLFCNKLSISLQLICIGYEDPNTIHSNDYVCCSRFAVFCCGRVQTVLPTLFRVTASMP